MKYASVLGGFRRIARSSVSGSGCSLGLQSSQAPPAVREQPGRDGLALHQGAGRVDHAVGVLGGDAVAVDGVAEVVGGREAADHEDVGPELAGQIVGDHLEEHPGVEAFRHGRLSCVAASARSRRPAR
jgi:hypothetical protein